MLCKQQSFDVLQIYIFHYTICISSNLLTFSIILKLGPDSTILLTMPGCSAFINLETKKLKVQYVQSRNLSTLSIFYRGRVKQDNTKFF